MAARPPFDDSLPPEEVELLSRTAAEQQAQQQLPAINYTDLPTTSTEDPAYSARGTSPYTGANIGIRPTTAKDAPLPATVDIEYPAARAGGEGEGGFARSMRADAQKRGAGFSRADAQGANLIEGALRKTAQMMLYIPDRTLNLIDQTVGAVARKFFDQAGYGEILRATGLTPEGNLPMDFVNRIVNAENYQGVEQLVKIPGMSDALEALGLNQIGTGENIGFQSGFGRAGEHIGEFAGIGLVGSALGRIGGAIANRTTPGSPTYAQQQLQRDYRAHQLRQPGYTEWRPSTGGPPAVISEAQPGVRAWKVSEDGIVQIRDPRFVTAAERATASTGKGTFAARTGEQIRLTAAEMATMASRHPGRDAVTQIKFGAGLGTLYATGEAAFPDWENAGAYFSMSPMLVPAVVMSIRQGIPRLGGALKNTYQSTAEHIHSTMTAQAARAEAATPGALEGVTLPSLAVLEESLVQLRAGQPRGKFNPETGRFEVFDPEGLSGRAALWPDRVRSVIANAIDNMNPNTPNISTEGGKAAAINKYIDEQVLPLINTEPARLAFEQTEQIHSMYNAANWNAYVKANPRASTEEIAAYVEQAKFDFTIAEQYMERSLLAEQARIEGQATAVEANEYLHRKAQNFLKADHWRLMMMGISDEELDIAPTMVYDAINGRLTQVATNLSDDITQVETMLQQVAVPGTVPLGMRPQPESRAFVRRGGAREIETTPGRPLSEEPIPITPEGEVLTLAGRGSLMGRELALGESQLQSVRQVVQDLRAESELAMDNLFAQLGLDRSVTMGQMGPVREAMLEATGLKGFAEAGNPLTESPIWRDIPDTIRSVLTSTYRDIDFNLWKQWRSSISHNIRGMYSQGNTQGAQALTTLKAHLDDMVWGVNGKATTPGKFAEWATKYDEFVIAPFETQSATRVLQRGQGNRANLNTTFYQIPEEEVARQFIRDSESIKAFNNLFGPNGLKYRGLEWDPREAQILRDAILDDARPYVINSDGVIDPTRIRQYLQQGNRLAALNEARVPNPLNPEEIVPMTQVFEETAALTEGLLARQSLLNTRQRGVYNHELNRVFGSLEVTRPAAQGQPAVVEATGTQPARTADELIAQAMKDPKLMRDMRTAILEDNLPPQGGMSSEQYNVLNAEHKNRLQTALNNSVFNHYSRRELFNPSKDDMNPFMRFQSQGDWLKANEAALTDLMGREHVDNMIILNEVAKRIHATVPAGVGAGLTRETLLEAFAQATGMTLQGYSARTINMLEGRIGARTSAVWLFGQAAKAGQLRRMDEAMKTLMTNPALARLLTQNGPSAGAVTEAQGRNIRHALWYAGIAPLADPPPTETVTLPTYSELLPALPGPSGDTPGVVNVPPAPPPAAQGILPNAPAVVPQATVQPPPRADFQGRPIQGQPGQLPGRGTLGRPDFASLFPNDPLGQAVAERRQPRDRSGIMSLLG